MNHSIGETRDLVTGWFALHARPLPWRAPGTSAWGVLVSEIMLQQTPAARVEGPWSEWMRRWPDPAALSAAPTDEVLRAWGRLGYPRRALRLKAAASAILERHGGIVPSDEDALLQLPGIGGYTAAAVCAFAFGRRALVLDVNIRRVLARLVDGVAQPPSHESVARRRAWWEWVPEDGEQAAVWSEAVMELGALVCTSASPTCTSCPVSDRCAWLAAGSPPAPNPRRSQPWEGTDRQCRGWVMARLRECDALPVSDLAWPRPEQLTRCIGSLIDDGLAVVSGGLLSLGGSESTLTHRHAGRT